ncbi:MAG: class I poly(R)-hydroxyalkanoic acid synthase [Paracoccus sp. (in: a-proteobacteria)]|nr:class I poly(R)-hydroxyalkanoic acid synthase [Paracoccus sp. (in: a-proteobacteria)]
MASKDTEKTPRRGKEARRAKTQGSVGAGGGAAPKTAAKPRAAGAATKRATAPAAAAQPAQPAPVAKPATAAKPATSAKPAKPATAARPATAGKQTSAKPARKPAGKPAAKTAAAPAKEKKPAARRAATSAAKPAVSGAAVRKPGAPRRSGGKPAGRDGPDPATIAAAASADLAAGASVSAGAAASPAAAGETPPAAGLLAENIERIEALTQRLATALAGRPIHDPGVEGPGADLVVNAGVAMAKLWAEQPARILEQQVKYWGATLGHFAEMQSQIVRGKLTAPPDDAPETDKRFRNPLWQTHPYFNMVKRQYQTNAAAMREAAQELDMLNPVDQRRLDWLTNQIIDMFAPTNFLATNPDAIERALETEGESLVKGLENLVRDVETHGGELVVSLADRNAFSVGENIGTAPGRVVRRERLYELIQYAPTTDQVHARPLVIFPPWINKFYILDLKPENSLIRWIVDQGYTLFVVSWRNPDASFADVGLEDYVEAYLSVMQAITEITGQPKLNAIGYCIGGTTLSLTLALMAQRGDDRVASATFFTTLTDFGEQGEFTPFLQNDFVDGIAAEVERAGIFASSLMTRTMSFLRANDLVWGPAIRSYLLGEAPPAFDLLYWNGDSTNLPGRMTVEYLRGLCQQNQLVGDGYEMFGHKLKLSDVRLPLIAIGCESDHIAPWKFSWKGVAQMGSDDKRFILSESGHIAGIVNPPSKKKYGHYTGSGDFSGTPDSWREGASFAPGSWWPVWREWLAAHSGPMTDSRQPDDGFAAAPGSYVHQRY